MGHVTQSTTLVCSFSNPEAVKDAHEVALVLFPPGPVQCRQVSEILCSPVNAVRSFMVSTSGSQLGKSAYQEDTARREKFVKYLRERGSRLEWVNLLYGDDDMRVSVLGHSDDEESFE